MSNSLLLLMALMGGNAISQPMMQAMMDAQKDNFERWSKLLQSLGAIITTGVFFLRGMPAPVDAAGNPVFTNEALSKQISASFTEGKREAFWVSVVNGVIMSLTEFLRPSAVQQALFASLVNRPATQTVTALTTQPGYPSAGTMTGARSAGQILRQTGPAPGFVRAQSIYFNPQTGELVAE